MSGPYPTHTHTHTYHSTGRRRLAEAVGPEWQSGPWWNTVPSPFDEGTLDHIILPAILRVTALRRAFGMDEYANGLDANFGWPDNNWAPGRGIEHLDVVAQKDPAALDRALSTFSLGPEVAKEMVLEHRLFVLNYRTRPGTHRGDSSPMPCGALAEGTDFDRLVLDCLREFAVRVGGYTC